MFSCLGDGDGLPSPGTEVRWDDDSVALRWWWKQCLAGWSLLGAFVRQFGVELWLHRLGCDDNTVLLGTELLVGRVGVVGVLLRCCDGEALPHLSFSG